MAWADRGHGLTLGTSQATTSGTLIDFTGIPSWAKRITVMFNGVSTSGTNGIIVQLGTSGGVITSGYSGYSTNFGSSNNAIVAVTTGLPLNGNSVAANNYYATCTVYNYGANQWLSNAVCPGGATVSNGSSIAGGSITLSGTLTTVRITTVNGTDTFDAGSVNIIYEG